LTLAWLIRHQLQIEFMNTQATLKTSIAFNSHDITKAHETRALQRDHEGRGDSLVRNPER
jgi:hypothetical protein